MNSISIKRNLSLKELVSELYNPQLNISIESMLRHLHITSEEINQFSTWNTDRYTRNCVFKNKKIEILALCWAPGQETLIHGHDEQKCWVYMVYGELSEQRYALDKNKAPILESMDTIKPEALCYIDDNLGYHSLKNNTAENAVSLHVYVEPFESCLVYNNQTSKFESRTLSYDQVWDLK